MSFKYNFSIKLFFGSEKNAKIILAAINPERASSKRVRSETHVTIKKDMLSINIRAEDLTALRASFNACLKPVLLSKSLLEVF